MRQRFPRLVAVCAIALSMFVRAGALTNGGSITALNAPLTENFDSLAQTGTGIAWADNVTLPGWYSSRTTYNTGTGSSNTGALYSFGVAGTNPVTDRALGSVGSGGTGTVYWGVRLVNNTGAAITSLDVSYVGEEWRSGGSSTTTPSVAQTVDFQYQVANAGVITGINTPATNWLDYDPLDFTSPVFGTTAASALDGNAAANRLAKSSTLTVSIAPGQEIWLRWKDIDHANNDHGLAIDDFSVTAHGAVVTDDPPAVSTTSPAAGAAGVAITSAITVTFSENVTAAADAFSLECPAGTAQAFTQSPAPGTPATTMTLTPSAPLPGGTTCKVTVSKNGIADVDGTADHMANDVSFSFTTLADAAPAVTTTSPASGATNVPIDASIVINFSESVSAGGSAFALECPAGSPQTLLISGSPSTSFTLTPASHLPFATTCTVTVSAPAISDTDANDPPDHPAANVAFSFTTAIPDAASHVIINELDADTPGSPADTAEFVELYDGGIGNTPLDGLVVVFYDGNGDTSYAAFDLTGKTTNASGYFTIGNPGVANVDLTFDPGPFGFLQNGADAVALYVGSAASFPNGTPVRTTNVVDAIVYGTDDAQDSGLRVLLNTGQLQVNENATGDGPDLSLQRCPSGAGGARNTSNYYPSAPTPGAANTCPAPRPASTVVISQLYGGGGNSGASYHNDFVELFNRSGSPVDLTGWSLQYASSTGNGWDANLQPLGGTIGAGEYYLVALGSNGGASPFLPAANINGQINLSATAGKVALVNSFDPLVGGCPIFDAHLMDFVGYGSADCGEAMRPAPAPSNTTALFRKGDGATDTDNNANDLVTGAPNPNRRTAPIVELGPFVLRTDPRTNAAAAPRDATIEVTFTEPVDVDGNWFDISCAVSGTHDSATFAGGGQDRYITPNVNFIAGESCTVTIFKDRIHDQDTDDAGPNTDTLPADYVWSFTIADGTPPPYPPSVHLTMGNPNGANGDPDNYLMEKPEYALSYNRDLGRPNWVSWHLSDEWIGSLARVDTFRPDPEVPPDWYRVQSFDFSGSGFDRGHMTPNADRDKETSIPINQATYLMSNMVAQAPGNNQGPWAAFEGYLRTLVDQGNELYIVSGPAGVGGYNGTVDADKNPIRTDTLANGHVTVPASTWKVALVLPKNGGNDVSRVSCSTRTIAIIMPNQDGIRNDDWHVYQKTVNDVEALTGYDFFSNVPEPYQVCIQAGKDGVTPNPSLVPGTQTIAFTKPADKTYGDAPFTVAATGGKSGNPVTFEAAGACASSGTNGETITITGAGTCTITANQAAMQSGTDTVYLAADPVTRMVNVAQAIPQFSGLTTDTIQAGTASKTVGGTIAAGSVIPTGSISITLGGVTHAAAIAADGSFSTSFTTASLAPSTAAYPIAYSYGGDANFTGSSGGGSLTVTDSVAPVITAISLTHGTLDVPNHKLFDVVLTYDATDLGADGHTIVSTPVCRLSVSSNEPENGLGDGDTSPDWIVFDARHLQLRAERSGLGNGRIYTLTVQCTDGSGNQANAAAFVRVPK